MKKRVIAYSDLNFIQKIIYRIRLRKYLKHKTEYGKLVGFTLLNEITKRKDSSYNDYIKNYF